MSHAPHRSHWSNRWAFIMATAGSAIGLGNIWKFPYMTGVNGGSAFVLVFLACIALVGIPLMMTEIMLGRRSQRNPVDGMEYLAEEAGVSSAWKIVGLVGLVAGLLILGFYSVIAGWVLDYVIRAAAGHFAGITGAMAQNQFEVFLAEPQELLLWHSIFMFMTMSVVARGVNSGLEKATKILMPALFVILLILLGYSMAVGDFAGAVAFMFTPDFSRVTPGAVLSALGHAFFSLSLGMGAVMVYGSYLQRHVSIARTTVFIAVADTLVGLLVGLAIFALVFANGLEPGAGPGLIFQTLPIAFGQMPGGRFMGTLFFLLVVFAAWTSSISLVEPALSWLTENTRLSRNRAALLIGLICWLLGIAVLLSFNEWKDVRPVFGLNIFDILDKLTTNILLPLGGLAMAIFAAWVMKTNHAQEELDLGDRLYRAWRFTVRYVSPVAIAAIFLYLIGLVG